MGLLTREYYELQKQLHAEGNYGKGVDAEECAAAVREFAEGTILDYGAGKGHLRSLLSDREVREYDPCIEGKDSRPEIADYVVCADVLEHVEPECLGAVISHLREVTRKRLVVVIATRPSNKTLADGRNAHLIVESADWWKQKLERLFRVLQWSDRTASGKGIFGILEPIAILQGLKAIGVLSDEERNEYVKQNISRTWRRIPQHPIPGHNGWAIICCYGPSIRESYKHIEEHKKIPGAKVISVSGVHDFLRKKGIFPDFHVECDPRIHKSHMIKRALKKTTYILASCCHPDFVKRFSEEQLVLWHLFNGPKSYEIRLLPSESKEALIPGGGSIALRTMVLFYYLGYRNFIIHGFDCSFAEDGSTHAGPHKGKVLERIAVNVEGTDKWFETAPVMTTYANHMLADLQNGRYPGCRFDFMGERLFQTMLEKYVNSPKIPPAPGFGRDYFNLTEEHVRPEEIFGDEKAAAVGG